MIKLRLDNNHPPPYNLQIIGGLTPHSFQKIVTCQLIQIPTSRDLSKLRTA